MESITVLDLLKKKLNPDIFPVSRVSVDFLDEPVQDAGVTSDRVHRKNAGENSALAPNEIRNVRICGGDFLRTNTPYRFFLDGCRRAYYLCDIATESGRMLPVFAGQVSSAVLERDNTNGRVKKYKYNRRGLLLLPEGGDGLPRDEITEFSEVFNKAFEKQSIQVITVKNHNVESPQDDSLAKLNAEMQKLEVDFLSQMTATGDIHQQQMIIVDGALQFTNIPKEQLHSIRYAVGVSKHFNLHLTDVYSRGKEIGTLLIKLANVGDRTKGFRLRMDNGVEYCFWYLRIRPCEHLTFPFAGIVKMEKVLYSQDEKENGLTGDAIDTLSQWMLLETSVAPYGQDFRWASHIYPIFLTEVYQKSKFAPDFLFESLLRRKVAL